MPVLVLDCDGVLADTERDGHLPAFNRAFGEFGIPVSWTEDEYAVLLGIGGGKERLRAIFTPHAVAAGTLPGDPDDQDLLIRRLHERKTQIFVAMVEDGAIPPRPGVARLVGEALDDGWTIAVASTSAEASVRAVLERAVGQATAARFGGVFAGDVVARKKPAPDIYLLACRTLDAQPGETVVVEDSAQGALAATDAGLAHLVTVSRFTRHEGFPGAAAVVTHLGEPDDPLVLLANRLDPAPGDMIRVPDLARASALRPSRTETGS